MCTMESFLETDGFLLTSGDCADRLRGVGLGRSKCDEFGVLLEESNVDVWRRFLQDIVAPRGDLEVSPASRNE
jgi:hypothetical protein